MEHKPEGLQGSWANGGDWDSGIHDARFLVGDTQLLLNLNKDIARSLFFVSSANKPIPRWRGLLYKEEGGKCWGVQPKSPDKISCGSSGESGTKNMGLFMALLFFFFSRKKKNACFSHPKSSLQTEFGCFWKEHLAFTKFLSLLSRVQDPIPVELRRNLSECTFSG